jgi:predicted  nucleic acid-binding Zn ribbon protein
MHHLSIKYKKIIDKNELWHLFYDLLASLRHSGQLIGRDMNAYVQNNEINAVIVTAEESSFETRYLNKYVKNTIKTLERFCGNALQIKWVGTCEDQENSICSCKKYQHLLLRYADTYSYLQCGSCNKSVPLYKLKKLKDYGFEPITSWASNYFACVLLDVNCSVGEQWAMDQQTKVDSELAVLGRNTAKLITDVTGIKCYYFLNNLASHSRYKDVNRPCPCCNNPWRLESTIHQYVDYKCDNCLLMSVDSYNIAEAASPYIYPQVVDLLCKLKSKKQANLIVSLVEKWESFARDYVHKEELIYEWQNDMDARRLLEEALEVVDSTIKKSILNLIKPLDNFVKENTFEINECVWGVRVEKENKYNRKKHWYYYRINKLVFSNKDEFTFKN